MSVKPVLRLLTIFLAMAVLAACSNRPGTQVTGASLVKSALKKKPARTTPDAQTVAASAATVLASTNTRVIIISIPRLKVLAPIQEVAANGNYTTYGTPDRRSITLRDGLLAATRGLGQDLMSADLDQVQALIAAPGSGTATRVNRYLDGENLTAPIAFNCTLTAGAKTHLQSGEIDTDVTQVTESCTSASNSFENTYLVSPEGRVVQSRQWLNPLHGYMTIQHLR